MKTFFISSLGCFKNQVDTEVMISSLENKGYTRIDNAGEADYIIINSCGFIESAQKESLDVFFGLNEVKKKNAKIIFTGCMANRWADELKKELREADVVFRNDDPQKIWCAIEDSEEKIKAVARTSTRTYLLSRPGQAYLKIAEGCSRFCAFCSIPFMRGPLMSVNRADIMAEAKRLVKSGIKEISLLSQDLSAYGMDKEDNLISLLDELVKIEGDWFIRMLYIHPDHFPKDLISKIKESNGKILPYFDLPFQHSDTNILKAMGRLGDSQKYLDLINNIREELPNSAIRTTLMLGFPGDSEKSFNNLLDFVNKAQFDWMGSFIYSPQEDTRAYKVFNENKRENKEVLKQAKKWQNELNLKQDKITEAKNKRYIGGEYRVLIEEDMKNGEAICRIYSQAPEVDGCTVVKGKELKEGEFVRVKILQSSGPDLYGQVIQ